MKKILLDTNFLVSSVQFGIDLFSEIERICHFRHEIYVLDKTVEELGNIVEAQRGKHRDAAKISVELLKIKKVGVMESGAGYTDDVILEYGRKGFLVATQDKDLKRKLVNQGCSVITMRQKKTLDIENYKGFE